MTSQEESSVSGRQGEIQKKTFTRWINNQFRLSSVPLSVQDLYEDLRDGKILFSLLQALTGQSLVTSFTQALTSVDLIKHVLSFLQSQNVKLKSTEVAVDGISSGDRATIHSLLWAIISRWHVEMLLKNILDPKADADQLELQLLAWCQNSTNGYKNVTVRDFTTSWRDGLAFNALIHRFCPDLFSFDVLLAKDNVTRLNHAFAISQRKLRVPQLLDVDDVDIEYPEKCSITMYLVYLCGSLSQQKSEITNSIGSSGKAFIRYSMPVFSAPENGLHGREPSQDFGGFMGAVGETLAWLLDASHTLSNQPPVADDMDELKYQFHEHEKFMVQLTQQQSSIGSALQEGNHLLGEGLLTSEEEAQVERQMALLNNRWEELRVQAMDRQTRLQQCLMSKQQQQLDSLSQWLTSMESHIQEIKKSSSGNEKSVRNQIEEQKAMQAEVEDQQERVDNLQSMVVVVDETNSELAYLALEQQLESLGNRWTSVCQWVEERGLMLQEALARWRGFNERLKEFTDWLSRTEDILSDMHGVGNSDIQEVVKYVQRLKRIENEMEKMMKYFDELNDVGLDLVQYIGNDETGIQFVNTKLLECQERWDNLVQCMELKGKEIVHSGIELKISKASNGSQTITVSRTGEEPVRVTVSPTASYAVQSSAVGRLPTESGRKKEFDRQVAALSQWLDQVEVTQEIITTEPENAKDRLTIEEQLVLIEDAEKDVKAREPGVDQLRSLGGRLIEELRNSKESTEAIEEVMSRLESRWKRLNILLVDNLSKVNISSKSKQVYSELSALHEVVENYKKWISSEGPIADEFMEISRQLEHCRVKLKAFLSHESHLDKINVHAKELAMALDSQSKTLGKDLEELNRQWLKTHQKLRERQSLLTDALQKTPPKSFMDSFLALVHWLDKLEVRLETACCTVNTADIMEGHVRTCKEIQLELRDRTSSLEYVNHTAQDLINRAPSEEKSMRLRDELHILNTRWTRIQSSSAGKIAALGDRLEQLKQYKSQKSEVMNWVEEMELFLTSEEAAVGHITALQAQLAESDGAMEDMKTMKTILDTINLTAKRLRPDSDEAFVLQFDSELEHLNTRWKALVDLSQKHNSKLKENLDMTKKLSDDIGTMEQWIDRTAKEHTAREYTVHSISELADLRKKFQALNEEMKSSKKSNMEKLDQRVASIAALAAGDSAHELIEKLAKVKSKWVEVGQNVEDNLEKFSMGEENFVHFKDLVSLEMNWIGELKEKLSKGSNLSGDAEELSEELDDLENFLASQRSENPEKINNLAHALLNNHIMVTAVTTDLDGFTSQHRKLMNVTKERTDALNAAILAAQNRESQIIEMSQWMTDVTVLLQARLDADILAGDTPNEFESLKSEFEQHGAVLIEFEREVTSFREQDKEEEAERLEQQLLILRKHYSDVSVKFCKFQRPVDFDPKLAHIKHVLEELEEQIHVLEISSLEPNDLQNQLEQCMKFYKTMSEIKPEVEYVIKTGRQVVEKKQVDHPEKLTAELDTTKHTYNELGTQVTRSKSILEQTLKLMRKLKSESAMMSDYMHGVRNELKERENVRLMKDIDDELLWIKATHLEVNKKQPHLSILTDVVSQLHKIVDESIMTEIDASVKDLGAQLNELNGKITHHKTVLQHLAEELERAYVDFETTQRELMIWMDNVEDFLNKLSSTFETEQSSAGEVQQLLDDHDQLMCQLDQARDSAVGIISKSDRYSKVVEPLLTLLNQRWQEVTNRLKVFQIGASTKQRKSPIESSTAVVLNSERVESKEDCLIKLIHELEDYQPSLLKNKENIFNLSGTEASRELRELDEIEENFQKKIDQVLASENHSADNSPEFETADDATTLNRTNLLVLWKKVLKEFEHQRLAIILDMDDFSEFRQTAEELDTWLNEMEKRLFEAMAIEDQMQSLNSDLTEKKSSFDNLIGKMHLLHSPYAKSKAFELLTFLNCRFNCFKRQIDLYQKTWSISPHISLRRLQVRKIVFISETSQYVRDLQCLMGMLSDLELELKTPLIEDRHSDIMEAKEDEIKTIEDALNMIQLSVESAENSKDEAQSKASEDEKSQIDKTLTDIRCRLLALQKEAAQRKKSEENFLVAVDHYASKLDEITLWLNETENVVNDRIGEADREQTSKLLDALRERESHLPEKQAQLRSLSRNARQIFYHPEIIPAAEEQIMRDLSSAIERWNKIVLMLSKKRRIYEEQLLHLNLFHYELEKLRLHIPSARIQMDSIRHALATDRCGVDQKVKVIQDILEDGEGNVKRLKYHCEQLESHGKEPGIGYPSPVRQRMNDVLADWTVLQDQAVTLRNSIGENESMLKGVEEVICHVELSALTTTENTIGSFTSLEWDLSEWPELDQRASSLEKTIKEIVQDTLLRSVEIGNVSEIEAAMRNANVKQAELEIFQKELVATNESLAADLKTAEENLHLEKTVEKLRQRSEEAKADLARRKAQLEDMLLECRQLEDTNIEFERWISSLEEESSAQHSSIGHTVAALEELIEANKRLQLEAVPWQNRVDSLHGQADKLIEEYKQDDGTKLKTVLERTNERWTALLSRLEDRSKALQNMLNSIYRFDTDLKDFLLWLTKVEIVLKHHGEILSRDNLKDDSDENKQVQGAFKDLQCEVDEHQDSLDSLNSTGNQIILGLQTEKAESLRSQLDDMNRRWNQLKLKSGELRNRLEVQINGNVDSHQDVDVANWLTQLDNDLNVVSSPSGETFSLHYQRDCLKQILLKLETRRGQMEQLLKTNDDSETVDEILDPATGKIQNGVDDPPEIGKTLNDPNVLLQKKWIEIERRSVECEKRLCQAIEKMESFEEKLNDATQFLMLKEMIVSRWPPVADLAPDILPGELNQIKSFLMDLIANETKIETCKQTADDLKKTVNCTVSPTNRARLSDLQEKWSHLESEVEDRQQQVISTMKSYGSGTQYHLSMAVFPPWERSLAEAKVPYYINHSTETTQWDHPEMTRILSSLAELNTVKFSAYRTSMKLRRLQKRFSLDLISLSKVQEAFDRHGLGEFSLKLMTVAEAIQCLSEIYGSLPTQESGTDVNASLCIDLVLNWLLNLFDTSRTGQIPSLSFRVAILVMCSALLEEKQKALFNSVANADGHVSQQQLGLLLQACVQIPKHLGEIAAFGGSGVDPSIKSCFEKAGNPSEIKVSHFLDWVKLEPQSLVWLPVLHRLVAAESAKHQAKCNVCKDCPILGFRYRCLKCFSFDMCQNCFFAGRKAKNHKLTHPMQEYCLTTTSSEDMRDFTKMFKNKFRSKQYFKKHPRLGYLPVQSLGDEDTLERNMVTSIDYTSALTCSSPLKSVVTNSGCSTPSTGSLSSRTQDHHSLSTRQATRGTSPVQSCSQTNGITTIEMHSRLELYASRLAEIEQKRRETTPDWDDEHNLISQYCQSLHGNSTANTLQSPMQIMMAMDAEQKAELEAMIRDLEEENKLLQAEYDQLREAHREESTRSANDTNTTDLRTTNGAAEGRDAEMIAEAKLLLQHKGRLEARMQILEDHNCQLDSQLRRLRQLLAEQSDPEMRIVTYPVSQSPLSSMTAQSSVPLRVPPSFTSSTRQSFPPTSASGRGYSNGLNGDMVESKGHLEALPQDDQLTNALAGKSNIDNLFQVAEEVGRAVETLVNIMTDDERHAEEEKDLAAKEKTLRKQ